jgi:hypothetical protein
MKFWEMLHRARHRSHNRNIPVRSFEKRAPYLEDVWESGDIAPPFLALVLDGGFQIYAPAALEPQVPIGRKAEWVQGLVWILWKREKILPL